MLKKLAYALAAIPLALFFAFVGGNKALASLADLALHHAWTVWLPPWLGRVVGISEILCAFGLLMGLYPPRRRWAVMAGSALVLNQAVAAMVHAMHGETGALSQNAVLAVVAAIAALIAGLRPRETLQ